MESILKRDQDPNQVFCDFSTVNEELKSQYWQILVPRYNIDSQDVFVSTLCVISDIVFYLSCKFNTLQLPNINY